MASFGVGGKKWTHRVHHRRPPSEHVHVEKIHEPRTRTLLRSNSHPYGGWHGQSDKDLERVNRHTGLFVKMIYLHALATAGRCRHPAESGDVREVGFMLEQPKDPRSYLLYTDPLAQDSVSFWRTSLWESYAEEAGLSVYSLTCRRWGRP